MYPLLFLIFLLKAPLLFSQTSTEFWFACPDATDGHGGPNGDQPINLRVATSNLASTVTVDVPANAAGFTPIVVNVPANSASTIDLSSYKALLENSNPNAVQNKGLRVRATNPITAYYELNTTYNTEIWALKGANALGTEFYTPFQTKRDNGSGYTPTPYATIDIVATEDNTTILVFPRIALFGHPANVAFTITLSRGQTYSLRALDQTAANHPSGTVIVSDKPIAVTVKDDSVGGSTGCFDMMGDQIVPVDIIGKDYIVTRGGLTSGDEAAYIMPVENNTKIYVNGNATPLATLFAGQTYRYDIANTQDYYYFTASKPVYMLHVSGFGCEMGEAILPPLNCAGSRKATIVRSQGDPRTFILNLIVRAGHQDAFVLNGGAYTNNTTVIQASDFTVVPGTVGQWMAAKKEYVTDAVFAPNIAYTISNTEDVFALGMVNGGVTTGCRFGYFSEYVGRIFVNAGNDTTICKLGTAPLKGSVTGGAFEGRWSTSGSGTFSPNDSTLNATYIPSNADTTLAYVDLTLASKSICFPVEDIKRIYFDKAPVAKAGAPVTMCANTTYTITDASAGNYTTLQWVSSGSPGRLTNATTISPTYNPSATDIAAGSVTLTLRANGTGKCLSRFALSTKVITLNPVPVANAGSNDTICASSNYTVLDAVASNASSINWVTSGTGTFINGNTSSPTYIPSAADLAAGNVNLTINITGANACNAINASSFKRLYFQALPTVAAGADAAICANTTHTVSGASSSNATLLWSTSGTGTFVNGTTLTPTYLPSNADKIAGSVVLTITANGLKQCNGQEVFSSKTLAINPMPTAYAGNDKIMCANNLITITEATAGNYANITWTSTGSLGTITNANTVNPMYTPSAADASAGNVKLILTATGTGLCMSQVVTDTMSINISQTPTVDAGSDQSYCDNITTIPMSGSITIASSATWTTGGTGVIANPNSLSTQYTPSALDKTKGFVMLYLTTNSAGSCLNVKDSVRVTFVPAPIANAGSNRTSCANNPNVTLNGSVLNAIGGVWSGGTGSFTPNNNDLNAVYIPTPAEITAGTVTLALTTVGGSACPASVDQMIITIKPSPVVNAGIDQNLCRNNANVTLNGIVTGATGGQWSGGLGAFTPSPDVLNLIYTPTQNELNNGFIVLTLKSTGNGICYQESDNILISFAPAPIVDAGTNKTVCANSASVTLNGSVLNASGGLWSTSGSGIFVPSNTQLANTTYVPSSDDITNGGVTIYLRSSGNGNCIAETDSMKIVITPAPVVDAGNNLTVCVNQLTVQLNGTIFGGTTTGVWSTSGTGTFTPNNSTLNAKYIASPQDSITQGCNLILSATNYGNCSVVKDTIKLNIFPGGWAEAGTDIAVCANVANISLNGQIQGQATGGVWFTSGTGLFVPNANTLNASYKPSANDIASGGCKLILQANSCNLDRDTLELVLTPAPIVNAGTDKIVCADVMQITLNGTVSGNTTTGTWSSSGSGYFTPNNSALNATYHLSSQDSISGINLYLTSTNNGNCQASTDAMKVTVAPAGYANAGLDKTACANNANVVLGGTLSGGATKAKWFTSGTGLFVPSDTILAPTYKPSANDIVNGNVTLSLTTTNSCNIHSDPLTVTFTSAPVVDAGANISVCANNANVILNGTLSNAGGSVWSSNGTGTFTPNNVNLTGVQYNISNQDINNKTVKIYLTSTNNGNCLAVKDSLLLTITSPPIVDAGENQNVCKYSVSTQLIGSVAGGSSTGIWSHNGSGVLTSNTNLNSTYIFSNADTLNGSVTFTLTSTNNANCLAETDQMTLIFGDKAFAFAGDDINVCANDMDAQLNGVVAAGANQGEWSIVVGTGYFTPNNQTLNAVYHPSATDSLIGYVDLVLTTKGGTQCLPGTDTVKVTIDRVPSVNAGNNQFVCFGTPINIDGTITNAPSGIWKTLGNGVFVNENNLNTYYIPTVQDSTRGYVDLVLSSSGSLACNTVRDTVRYTIGIPIIQNFTYSGACTNTNVLFSDNSTVIEGTITEWKWDFGGGNTETGSEVNHTFASAGVYSVKLTVKSNYGCYYSITKNISVGDLPIVDFKNSSNCFNEFVQFSDLSTVANGNIVQWSWDFGDGSITNIQNPYHNYVVGGAYTIKLTSFTNQGCNASISKTIIFHPTPVASFDNTKTCINSNVTFTDKSIISSGEITNWSWNFGDGTNSNERNPNHFYGPVGNNNVSLIITSNQGCVDTISKVLVIHDNPNAGFNVMGNKDSITAGIIINFTDISSGATQWVWNFGDNIGFSNVQSPGYIFNQLGEFTVSQVAMSEFNCTDTAFLKINVTSIITDMIYPPKLPTAFTPNGDGWNDSLFVRGGPFLEVELKIYNKWGELIFESNDIAKGWNGQRKGDGENEPSGAFIYTLRATTIDGQKYTRFGSVNLIR